MYVAGVDVGSTQTKAVILSDNREITARGLTHTGANVVKAAERAFKAALQEAGLDDWEMSYTVGTGYGRFAVPFGNTQITEISCHAKGAIFLFPETRTVLDIGGQDTKAIRVSPQGEVLDFAMNDKCAAGTGRFLEASAEVMGLTLAEMGERSLRATQILKITNVCTVFVESEIMNLLARGKKAEEILAGVHESISRRSVGLLRRVGLESELTFTGGVSRNVGMVEALKRRLQMPVNVSDNSQFIGAIGAALFALERAQHAAEPERAVAARG